MSQVMTLLLNHREQFHGGTIVLMYHFAERSVEWVAQDTWPSSSGIVQ